MRIVLDIPKEFEEHFNNDRFEDSLHRLSADAHLIAGNYEQEIAKMLFIALKNAKEIARCKDCAEAKTDTVDGAIYCHVWELRISSSVYMWEMPEKGFCYKGVKKKCGDVE